MWVFIFLDRSQEKVCLLLSEFADIFTFSTPAPMVSDLANIGHYAMPSLYDVMCERV